MTKVSPFSERSLKYWLSNFKRYDTKGLVNKPRRPKTNPNETLIRIKERIIELRKETKLCALKIKWRLEKENIFLSTKTVNKIIKKEGLTRKYRIRKLQYKYIKLPLAVGELVEVDIKYVPDLVNNRKYYQFTAIDCSSRWRYLKIYDDFSNHSTVKFVKELISIAPFRIRSIKTDNGSNFTNRYTGYSKSTDPLNPKLHDLDIFCQKQNIIHYLIDPGKPSQNGKVERSHRSDQESFYDRSVFKNIKDLENKIKIWNAEYNNLEHCGLNGLSPNEFLGRSKVQNVCT